MASTTQPYGKLLDYEQYIDHQLGRTRAKIKMTDVLTASLMLVAMTLGVLLLEVVTRTNCYERTASRCYPPR